MRFAFIAAHTKQWSIVTMCRVLAVSKAGYYAWQHREPSLHQQRDQQLTVEICAIQQQVRRRYGSPRVYHELRARGFACGEQRVARLMRDAGVGAKPRRVFRVTTQSQHDQPIAPNRLGRRFAPAAHSRLNHTWVADITYLPTHEGWLYLAVILDLASRRVVGWALRTQLTTELALTALAMALQHRRGGPHLHHSDRGVQYASHAYQRTLAAVGCEPSMSRVGNCWDNAVAESFFATLTKELLAETQWATRAEACRAVVEFIEGWYNRRRRHSTLGYRTPVEFEEQVLRAG